ncbi:MAG: hypothetical protein ACHP6H_02230 [Legionellales bacterium]
MLKNLRKIPVMGITTCMMTFIAIFISVTLWSFDKGGLLALLWGFLLFIIYIKFKVAKLLVELFSLLLFIAIASGFTSFILQPAVVSWVLLGFSLGPIIAIPLYWPNSGYILMYYAAADGFLLVVKLLHKTGIPVAGKVDSNPLFAAVFHGRYKTVEYLLNKFIPFNVPLLVLTARFNNDDHMVELINRYAGPLAARLN